MTLLLLCLKELNVFSVLLSNAVNISRYNSHKQKLFGIPRNLKEYKRALRPKSLCDPGPEFQWIRSLGPFLYLSAPSWRNCPPAYTKNEPEPQNRHPLATAKPDLCYKTWGNGDDSVGSLPKICSCSLLPHLLSVVLWDCSQHVTLLSATRWHCLHRKYFSKGCIALLSRDFWWGWMRKVCLDHLILTHTECIRITFLFVPVKP